MFDMLVCFSVVHGAVSDESYEFVSVYNTNLYISLHGVAHVRFPNVSFFASLLML